MSAKVEETGENYFRKSPNLDQVKYHHLALLLKKQDEVPVDEETVRKFAINKVNSIMNNMAGERQELEMRKRVLMNTHIRAVNNKVKAVEKIDKREVGNVFFSAKQGVQAKSARPEPSSDSDSDSDSDSSDSDSDSSDSDLSDSDSDSDSYPDLSDSDLSDPEVTEDQAKKLENEERANRSEFESEIETALKGCFIGRAKKGKKTLVAKKTVSPGKKTLVIQKTVGLKRKNPGPADVELELILERMQKEATESPPKCKRIRLPA